VKSREVVGRLRRIVSSRKDVALLWRPREKR